MRGPRRGTVLIVVLWASLGLVSVALLFGHSMMMAYRGSDNDLAGRQADQAIEGAIRYAEAMLTSATVPGVLPDITTYENEAVPVGEAAFWFVGRQLDTGSTTDGKTRVYGLVDEASKLNLNNATKDMLQNLPITGMTPDFAQAIMDWRTPAGGNSPTGTSSSVNKQAPFESIEELAYVTGATRDILYGEDANLNNALDPNEDDSNKNLPEDNSDGKLDPGLLDYVTVFSREANKRSDGKTDRLNIATLGPNTDPLRQLLDDKLGVGKGAPIVAMLTPGTPLNSALDLYIQAKGDNFSAADFGKVAYELTTVDPATNPYLVGLINVNTASATVLARIPGLENYAAQIVTARANHVQSDTNYAWVADELGTGAATALATAGRFLTGKTSQVTADIAAVGRHGRGYRRVKVVIDNSTGTPRVIYRRNLAPFGWALGSDVRTSLASQKEMR
jgi:type II secretory pathway component PulK